MRPRFQHFTLSDRIEIQKRYPQEKKAQIARELGFHKSSLTREINVHSTNGKYYASVAQKIADAKARQKNCNAPKYNSALVTFINQKLNEDWSPEQISGFLKNHQKELPIICHETIYQMIYNGHVKREPKYRKKFPRKYRKKRLTKTPVNIDRKSINDRPKIINKRQRFGDWEGDLIVGRDNKGAIATMVERKAGFLIAGLMYGKSSDEFKKIVRDIFAPIDNEILKSITYDNGTEASDYKNLEAILNCDIYFANPGSPWQRGTNENTNGLLRRYFPKKTNLHQVDPKLLDRLIQLINSRPRKRLAYRTPEQVLKDQGLQL